MSYIGYNRGQGCTSEFRGFKASDDLGKQDAKTVVIKNMDHMFKEYKGEKTVLNMKQYKKEATAPIHTQLKAELRDWLTEHYL